MFSLVSHINHCQYHCRIHTRSQHPRSHILNTYNTIIKNNIILCIAHYIQNYKYAVIFHTHYNFFSQLQRFFSSFIYIDKDFHNHYFRKIFAVLYVVCKDLNSEGKTDSQILVVCIQSCANYSCSARNPTE